MYNRSNTITSLKCKVKYIYIYIYIYIHKNYIYIFKKLESFKNALLGDAPNVMGKPKGIPLHLGWQIK